MEEFLKKHTFINKKTNFIVFTTKMIISIVVALCVCVLFSSKKTVLGSYVMCTIAFAVATFFMSYLFFGKTKVTKVIMTAFFLKIIIGLVHYLLFFDSHYFSSSGNIMMYENEEYSTVFNAICAIANNKIQYGLWHTDLLSIQATHSEMMHILSFPFVFFGNYILTISPFNAFCSSIVCVSLLTLGKSFLSLSDKKLKLLLYLLAYFPMFIISSYLARDIAGMAIMSIGVAMFFLSNKFIYQVISLVCAMFLLYLHRTIYPILFLIAVMFTPMMSNKKNFLHNALFAILLMFAINALGETYLPFLFTSTDTSMYESTMEMGSSNIIIKTVLLFIGPLWRQMYTAPEYSFVLQETFVIVIMDASILALWKCRSFFDFSKMNPLMFFGLLLLCVGAFNAFGHVPYIAVGVLFLLPFVVDVCAQCIITSKIKMVAIALVSLNIISLFMSFGVL